MNVPRRKVVLTDAIYGRQILAIFIVDTRYNAPVFFAWRVFLRFTVEYVAKQRSRAASRSRTGASGEHELGGEFKG